MNSDAPHLAIHRIRPLIPIRRTRLTMITTRNQALVHLVSTFVALRVGVGCEPIQVGHTGGLLEPSGGQAGRSTLDVGGGSAARVLGGASATSTVKPAGGASQTKAAAGFGGVAAIGAAPGGADTGGIGTETFALAGAGTGGTSTGGKSVGTSVTGGASSGGTGTGGAGTGGGAATSGGTGTGGGAPSGGVATGGAVVGASGGYAGAAAGGSGAVAAAAGWAGSAGSAGAGPSCTTGSLEIRGHVRSPRGVPIPDVKLTLIGQTNAIATTDSKGEYAFSQVCPGAMILTPSREGLRFCNESASYLNLTASIDEDFTGSVSGCAPPEIPLRVGIIVFDPPMHDTSSAARRLSTVMGWQDPLELAQQYRRAIEAITNGRVRYNVARIQLIEKFPKKAGGIDYTETTYRQCLADPATACLVPDAADYSAISDAAGICDDINLGVIDEAWLLGGPYFGFALGQRLAPRELATSDWPMIGSSCRRVTNVFGFSYERQLDVMLGGLQGLAESVVDKLYGGRDSNGVNSAFDRFELVDQLAPNLTKSGCGGFGYAPNASQPEVYDSQTMVKTFCDDFYDYPLQSGLGDANQTINCEAWGCSKTGYHRYWLRHLPAARGTAPDGKLADWWRYLYYPDDVIATKGITCSSSYATGWCGAVADGVHGTCNVGEWATAHQSTGWVQFAWAAPKTVSSVMLYDRGCEEQVVRGHLEFSDGSIAQAFGILEDSGTTPTTIPFAPKTLQWLRVVIDESTGGDNPGFGEISIQ